MLKGFFDILIEYNEGVKDGTINRVDEFLRFYGDGDTKKGLQYIKDDLLNVDVASYYLARKEKESVFTIGYEILQDIFFKNAMSGSGIVFQGEETFDSILKNTNANKVFERSEKNKKIQNDSGNYDVKSITDEMESFIRYLEEGMSK